MKKEKCIKCGTAYLPLANYCGNCGNKRKMRFQLESEPNDKKKFAFHSEYSIGRIKGDSEFAEYSGRLYYRRDNCILEIINEDDKFEVKDYFELRGAEADFRYEYLAVNSSGIYIYNTDAKQVWLFDFSGNLICSLDISGYLKDEEQNISFYIYDSSIFYLIKNHNEEQSYSKSGYCILEYSFKTGKAERVWSSEVIKDEIADYLLEEFRQVNIENEDPIVEEVDFDNPDEFYWIDDEQSMFYVNDSMFIYRFEILVHPKLEEGYEEGQTFTIAVERETGMAEILEATSIFNINKIICFDMQQNKMWYQKNDYTICETSIRRLCDIRDEDVTNKRTFQERIDFFCADVQFDGRHFYSTEGSYRLYSFDENGNKDEWNQSGHGNTRVVILGPFVYMRLDEGAVVVPHALKKSDVVKKMMYISRLYGDEDTIISEFNRIRESRTPATVQHNLDDLSDNQICEEQEDLSYVVSEEPKQEEPNVPSGEDNQCVDTVFVDVNALTAQVAGKIVKGPKMTDLYVEVVKAIIEKAPHIIGEKETHFTTDSERAAKYTGTTRAENIHGETVYIKTGFSTADKTKAIQKISELAGLECVVEG